MIDFREIWYWRPLWKPVEKFQIWLKSDNIEHYLSAFILLTAVRNILWLNNSAEGAHCCVSLAAVDVFVLLTGVRNILWLNNSAEGAHCCVSMAALDVFILLTATCVLGTIQRGRTLAFHGNRGYANAPRFYMIRTFLLLFTLIPIIVNNRSRAHIRCKPPITICNKCAKIVYLCD